VKPLHYFLSGIAVLALAACGGGGSGGPAITAASPTVAISTFNGKAIAAIALDATTNTTHMLAATGLLATIANNPTPSVFTSAQPCISGGTVTISGFLYSWSQIFQGDQLSGVFTSCSISATPGLAVTLGGGISATFTTVTAGRLAFNSSLGNFSVNSVGRVVQFTGAQLSDWDLNNFINRAFGDSLAVTTVAGGVVRNFSWIGYTQTKTFTPATTLYSLTSSIRSDSSFLGAGGGTFVLTNLAPIATSNTTGAMGSGAIKVLGTGNSSMLATVVLPDTVNIQVDANGDGIYESAVTVTTAELATYL
jgi:hypothetical protein